MWRFYSLLGLKFFLDWFKVHSNGWEVPGSQKDIQKVPYPKRSGFVTNLWVTTLLSNFVRFIIGKKFRIFFCQYCYLCAILYIKKRSLESPLQSGKESKILNFFFFFCFGQNSSPLPSSHTTQSGYATVAKPSIANLWQIGTQQLQSCLCQTVFAWIIKYIFYIYLCTSIRIGICRSSCYMVTCFCNFFFISCLLTNSFTLFSLQKYVFQWFCNHWKSSWSQAKIGFANGASLAGCPTVSDDSQFRFNCS